jgi:type IV pilus assembly protein PilQ
MVKVGAMKTKMQVVSGALILLGLVPGVSWGGRGASASATAGASQRAAEQPMLLAMKGEATPTPRLVLTTSGNPAYSAYSPQPDVYVIDLAQTSKANDLVVPTNLPSVVASVSVDQAIELGRPLTRVTLRFNKPYAPTSAIDGGVLTVSFGADAAPAVASAPEVALPPAVEAPAVDTTPADVSTTVEVPVAATPEPVHQAVVKEEVVRTTAPVTAATKKATTLTGISVAGSGADLRISLQGNGTIAYKAFRLSNPLRLVVDLQGVKVSPSVKPLNLADPIVKKVRVSQFKPLPTAVARVVFDLDEMVEYHVESVAGGVEVAFADAADARSLTASAELAQASVPQTSVASLQETPAKSEPLPVQVEAPKKSAPVATAENVFSGSPVRDDSRVPDVAVVAPRTREVINSASPEPAPQTRTTGTTAPVTTSTRMTTPQSTARTTQPENVFNDQGGTLATLGGVAAGASRTLTPGDKVYTGDPIDLNLKDADIKDVLRTFAQLTGLNIAIDPGVTGTVTVEFNDVPWDQALELILKQNGLTFNLQGNVMRIGTIDRLASEQAQIRKLEEDEQLNVPLQTVIKHLSYAKAVNVQTLLTKMASRRGTIDYDQRTNQIVITEIPSFLTTMLNLIDTVDIPTPQVMIEARVVETTKTFSRQLGISLGSSAAFDPSLGTGTGLVFPNRIFAQTLSGLNFSAGNPVLSLTMSNVLGTFDLDVVLSAAENEGLARIVSAPKITTQDNQAAEIQSGIQIPIQTRVNQTVTVSYVDATLRLSVTPQITAQDTVIMDITVQKTQPLPGVNVAGGNNAPLSTRRATTKLMVRDGGTTVIGGIYQSSENRGQDRLPFVSDIPIIGNLFKNHRFESTHDELLIFITPRIVRNA